MKNRRNEPDAPSAPSEGGLADLQAGQQVFYPGHGVALVTGVERREIGNGQQEFFILQLAPGGKVWLPTDKVQHAGVRNLITAAEARTLVQRVQVAPKADSAPWRERSQQYAAALRTGDAEEYTEILRQLLFRSATHKLSTTERRLLDAARSVFVAEISAALNEPAEDIQAQLETPTTSPRKAKS